MALELTETIQINCLSGLGDEIVNTSKIDQIAFFHTRSYTINNSKFCYCSLSINYKMNFVDTKSTVITGKPDQDKRILRKIWSNAITTQAKLELITRLCNLNLGFRGIEEFCNLQMGELNSKSIQGKFGRIRAKNIECIDQFAFFHS